MTIDPDSLWTIDWYLQRGQIPAARHEIGKLLTPRRPKPAAEATIGETVVKLAAGEVGVREEGHNSGDRIREYQSATWLPPGEWPWCAAFVCWVLREVARAHRVAWARPETAGAWDFERWAQGVYGQVDDVTLIKPAPIAILPGDILVYTFSHIGIAARQIDTDTIETIEGNTNDGGSREGDGVYRRRRTLSKIRSVIRIA